MKRTSPIRWIVAMLIIAASSFAWAKLEREQMAIESQLQSRIDNILSKTLPANSYLVTVKVEMDTTSKPVSRATRTARGGKNPFASQSQFVLPGVPQKKEFVMGEEKPAEETPDIFETETLVRRILITILVAPDISPDQIRGLREVIQASIPFNPLRGDELEIQNSTLLKPVNPTASGSKSGANAGQPAPRNTFFDRANIPLWILLGAIGTLFIVFLGFLFGPVRSFLNRLLAVLPRIGEQAAYAVNNAPAKTAAAGGIGGNGTLNGTINSRRNGADADEGPFRFIREDQLSKLPILLRQMPPAQAAIVLAYLPHEWASKMLGVLDAGAQGAIMGELAQAREVPPEIVKEVELLVKSKLPYLVGGVDWVQSVYQLTQPQTQRALLGSLAQQSPDLAQNLRRKTFFFEDVSVLPAGAMRVLVAEAGYPVLAQALRGEKVEFRNSVLVRLPVATREIILQELELSGDDRAATTEAKVKIVNLGQRLLVEGRIQLPERK